MSNWRNRIRKLQQSGIAGCVECGALPNEKPEIKVLAYGEESSEPEGIRRCSKCGRITGGLIQLTWD